MSGRPEEFALLDLVTEPVFLLDLEGRIRAANRHAAKHFAGVASRSVDDVFCEQADEVRKLLRRSWRTSAPVIGALQRGPNRVRVVCTRVHTDPPLIGLTVKTEEDNRFLALNQQITNLNREIRERKAVQAKLENALEQNKLLLRELQHRVKNTIQMIVVLLSRSAAASGDPQYAQLLEQANRRLIAVSHAYELMYRAGQLSTISARSLLGSMASMISETMPRGAELRVNVAADWEIPHDKATPFALIVNELLTNAQKHGLPGGKGAIELSFDAYREEYRLVVRDWGPGFAAAPEQSSFGLTLVRGLCRQLGARLVLENDGGAVCTVGIRTEGGG